MNTKLLEPSNLEIQAFETLQFVLSKFTYLVYFNHTRPLYADLDASKAARIGAVIYHIKGNDPEIQAYPNCSDIEPILFLS